jgi:UTP-glucose-1-phosphate uridylyltransferase
MEDHEKMLVNNLICETLNPKNAIVEVYKFIDKLNPKEQESFIKANNKYVIDNKVFNK